MATEAPPTVRDLRTLGDGMPFATLLILRKCTAKTASNGNTYLALELGDRTGSFHATVFHDHPQFDLLHAQGDGAVLRVEGKIDHYQGRFSPRLGALSLCDEAALEATGALDQLVEVPPEDATAMWTEFEGFVEAIQHVELRLTVRGVLEEIGEGFRVAPAAVAMHHAYRHGLLEHTLHMARAARALLPLYPEVDADLALAGVLVHDAGKVIEYEGGLATRRSRRGILQGHVVLGYQLVRKAGLKARLDADRLERLEHIVLSHQGEPAWGAAVWAATPEAVFVSMIDNLDARLGMVQRTLRQAGEGEIFSERLAGLNGPLLLEPLATPPGPPRE
jgi:3'-5' exoribonuclease